MVSLHSAPVTPPEFVALPIAPPLPPRTRFYNLLPAANGTPYVESLTGYINRLAWSYRVDEYFLIRQEILPLLSDTGVAARRAASIPQFAASAKAMVVNGNGQTSARWVTALETLTTRTDLCGLTLGSWAAGLSTAGLLRSTSAWCAACYQTWRDTRQVIYQPLLWNLRVLELCPLHTTRLQHTCPHCGHTQNVLARRTAPGYCTHCAGWLGLSAEATADHDNSQRLDGHVLAWQAWIAAAITDLWAAAIQMGGLSWNQIATGLRVCAAELGSFVRLAKAAHIPENSLWRWLDGRHQLSLDRLLEACYHLNVSPLSLLLADQPALQVACRNRPSDRIVQPRYVAVAPKQNQQAAYACLHAILSGAQPLRSAASLARSLGISPKTLQRWCPEEYAALCRLWEATTRDSRKQQHERDFARIRATMFDLHVQGIYPGQPQVARLVFGAQRLHHPLHGEMWRVVMQEIRSNEPTVDAPHPVGAALSRRPRAEQISHNRQL